MGDLSSRDPEIREAYRRAELLLTGLVYFVIEPPHPDYPYEDAGTLCVDSHTVSEGKDGPSNLPEPLPAGAFCHGFFVNEWNAYIYVAAMDARLDWVE